MLRHPPPVDVQRYPVSGDPCALAAARTKQVVASTFIADTCPIFLGIRTTFSKQSKDTRLGARPRSFLMIKEIFFVTILKQQSVCHPYRGKNEASCSIFSGKILSTYSIMSSNTAQQPNTPEALIYDGSATRPAMDGFAGRSGYWRCENCSTVSPQLAPGTKQWTCAKCKTIMYTQPPSKCPLDVCCQCCCDAFCDACILS